MTDIFVNHADFHRGKTVKLQLIFYQGNNIPEILMGAIILAVIFFLPFNIIGVYMAFGPWKTAPNMTYPVSIFLEDLRSFDFSTSIADGK